MSEKEDDFFDKTESQNFPVITMTTRLKKLIGKSDESEKTRESSVVKNSEEIIWNSEKASSHNKVKFGIRSGKRNPNQRKTNLVIGLEK